MSPMTSLRRARTATRYTATRVLEGVQPAARRDRVAVSGGRDPQRARELASTLRVAADSRRTGRSQDVVHDPVALRAAAASAIGFNLLADFNLRFYSGAAIDKDDCHD